MEKEKIATWSDFARELKALWTVAKWAFKMADSPESRGWIKQRYAALFALVVVNLSEAAIISGIFGGIVQKNTAKVVAAIAALGVLYTIQRVLIFTIWRAHEHAFGPAQHNIQRRITETVLKKSPQQHKVLKGLNHESIVKGKNRLFDMYIEDMPEAFELLCLVSISYVFLWFIVPVAGLVMTILIVAYISWSLYMNYIAAKEMYPIEEEFTAFERYLASRWKFAERVIVSAKERDELEELDERWGKVIDKDRKFWLWHLKVSSARDFFSVLVELGIVGYGASMVLTGQWKDIGILYPLFAWTGVIIGNMWRVGQMQRKMTGYLPTLKVMMGTLTVPPDVVDKPEALPINGQGSIKLCFNDVTYSYRSSGEQAATIAKASFTVEKSEKVAVIGPTGAGKSTLHYLVLRFMEPQSGSITANGKDIRDLTLESWRRAIAYIPQKPQIFDGTVRENLLYVLPNSERVLWNDEKLLRLMSVLAIDFGKRPKDENPLDIIVGKEGVQLSGGQAQRLAIGGAVIKKPRLMLIDEATSSLDSSTEKAVLEGLSGLVSGISTLVIAHRLSTVQTADKVIVLVDGRVEAIGSSFEELYGKSETFKRLATDQNLAIA